MQKLNHNEFKKLCQYLTICDIHSLRCVCKKFNLWINKYKITNHKCTTSKLNSKLIKAGCIGPVEYISPLNLVYKYVEAGHLYHIKYLMKNTNIDPFAMDKVFKHAVKYNRINICKWILSNYNIDLTYRPYKLMKYAAKTVNLTLCKWLYGQINNKDCLTAEVFTAMIKTGNLKLCKWFYSITKYNISKSNISCALTNGHIHIFKWFRSKTQHYMEVVKYVTVIEKAAKKGHLETCKLLIELSGNKLTFLEQQAFNHLCIYKWLLKSNCRIYLDRRELLKIKNLNVFKWIISNKFCDEFDPQELFEQELFHARTEICKWMFAEYKIDVNKSIKISVFKNSCILDLYKWLFSVSSKFRFKCEHSTEYFIDAICAMELHLDTIKWLWSKLRDKNIEFRMIWEFAESVLTKNFDIYLWVRSTFGIVLKTFKITFN